MGAKGIEFDGKKFEFIGVPAPIIQPAPLPRRAASPRWSNGLLPKSRSSSAALGRAERRLIFLEYCTRLSPCPSASSTAIKVRQIFAWRPKAVSWREAVYGGGPLRPLWGKAWVRVGL